MSHKALLFSFISWFSFLANTASTEISQKNQIKITETTRKLDLYVLLNDLGEKTQGDPFNHFLNKNFIYDPELIEAIYEHVGRNTMLISENGVIVIEKFLEVLSNMVAPNALLLRGKHSLAYLQNLLPEYYLFLKIVAGKNTKNIPELESCYRKYKNNFFRDNDLCFSGDQDKSLISQVKALEIIDKDIREYADALNSKFPKYATLTPQWDPEFERTIKSSIAQKEGAAASADLIVNFYRNFAGICRAIRSERLELMACLLRHPISSINQDYLSRSVVEIKSMAISLHAAAEEEKQREKLGQKKLMKLAKDEKKHDKARAKSLSLELSKSLSSTSIPVERNDKSLSPEREEKRASKSDANITDPLISIQRHLVHQPKKSFPKKNKKNAKLLDALSLPNLSSSDGQPESPAS